MAEELPDEPAHHAAVPPPETERVADPPRVRGRAPRDPRPEPPPPRPFTDLGNAERLVDLHGKNLRYVEEIEAWFIWDGKRWQRDQTREIIRLASETARSIPAETTRIPAAVEGDDGDKARRASQVSAISKWAKKSEEIARIKAMADLARSDRGIAARTAAFDADQWTLNLGNGTLDLRTRELRKHRRDDMITRIVPIDFNDKATCPLWEQFLSDIFLADPELIGFVKRAIGYTLTGSVQEQCFFICYGSGANGKGVLFDIMLRMLGAAPNEDSYARTADAETFSRGFQAAGGDRARPDLVRLRGARLVTSSEQNREVRFDEALIKRLTGGDPITARDLHERPITFWPVLKLWFAVNHKPKAFETGHGFWRRVKMIPFDYQVPDDKKDKDLAAKLWANERSGILNWALNGLADWLELDLGSAERIEVATEGYRNEMDAVGRFIAEDCLIGRDFAVGVAQLYEAYKKWCDAAGERALTKNHFGERVTERGHASVLNTLRTQWIRRGLGLRATPTQTGVLENSPDPGGGSGPDVDPSPGSVGQRRLI